MASWQNSSGKENHKSLFENVSHDRCIFCGSDREEIARTDFTIMFSEFEYSTAQFVNLVITQTQNKLRPSRIPAGTRVPHVILVGETEPWTINQLDRILSQ